MAACAKFIGPHLRFVKTGGISACGWAFGDLPFKNREGRNERRREQKRKDEETCS